MNSTEISSFRSIFYPEKIAVIGASESLFKFGGSYLNTVTSFGFKGRIYPVNPKADTIQGIKAYPSIEDVPDEVDLATITVPAPFVLDTIRGCIKKGVKGVQILSAGFKESGAEGEFLEREIVKVARKGGVRLIGPNCFGVYTPGAGLTVIPGANFSKIPGSVGLFSQSGGGTCDVIYMAKGRNVGFSVATSYGNACDIGATEMLRYFEADPDTKIVGGYIEGVQDGRSFYEALKSCAAKKPVVIYKGGLSDQGYRGTIGHTGSMAGSRAAWEGAIKAAGAVQARDTRDLVECLMAFNCLSDFSGGGAGILAGGGARVVEGLDAASAFNFSVPELDPETSAKIQSLLPPVGGKGGNPVDLANPGIIPAVINPIMEMLAEKDNINFLLMFQMLFYFLNRGRKTETPGDKTSFDIFRNLEELTEKAAEIRAKTGKPFVVVLVDIASTSDHIEMESGRIKARELYTSHGIPCFDTGLQAFSVLHRVAEYYKRHAAMLE